MFSVSCCGLIGNFLSSTCCYFLSILPQAVYVTETNGIDGAGCGDSAVGCNTVFSIKGSFVRTFGRLPMGTKFKVADEVGRFSALRLKKEPYPPDVMLGGVGVGHLLSDLCMYLKRLSRLYRIGTLNHRHVFFCFPV
jgi:hypothetical protein